MREYTEIKIINSNYSNSEILNFKKRMVSFKFEEASLRILAGGVAVREQNGNLIFETQGYYEGIPKSLGNKGTSIEIFKDWKREQKVADGIIQSKFFEKAAKGGWKIKQVLGDDNSKKVKLNMEFSQEEKELLEYGKRPRQMEDKWFVYMEDDVLHYFRSWTGIEIFRANLVQIEDEKWVINELFMASFEELSFFGKQSLFETLVNSQIKRLKKIMK